MMTRDDLQQLLASGPRKIHLVGVGGSGMSGLARLLAQRGHIVSGSDWGGGQGLHQLEQIGVRCFRGHAPENLGEAEIVSYSSAIPSDNPELLEAGQRGIPMVRRARTLAALVHPQKALLIAGTHGKTTTTSMVAHIMQTAGLDPSYYVGAEVPVLGKSAHIGRGDYFVIEVDESDGTMVEFTPHDMVLLNLEPEHLDFYEGIEAIEKAFGAFARTIVRKCIYCADDPGARKVCGTLSPSPQIVSYGLEGGNSPEWKAAIQRQEPGRTLFAVTQAGKLMGEAELRIPGKHNVSNALAAMAMTIPLGVSFQQAASALAGFTGASRRFDRLFASSDFTVVDDYAHHPTEIRETLSAARQFKPKRLLVAFQPHRYSRTRALHKEFAEVLSKADRLFLTDVYPASETPIEGVDGTLIANSITMGPEKSSYHPGLGELKETIGSAMQPGDLLLVMGAGNIHQVSRTLAEELSVYQAIKQVVSDKTIVRRYEPIAKKTTMRVGGSAKIWIEPDNEKDLIQIIRLSHVKIKENPAAGSLWQLNLIGRGSNLLIRDSGISGITIHLESEFFRRIEIQGEKVVTGAGARLKQVVMTARKANLTDLEFMEGIPGSIGGALWMNAGAMGGSIFDVVEKVRFLDMEGNLHEKTPAELDVQYRACKGLRNRVILSAVLKARAGDPQLINSRLREFEQKRWSSQPAAPSAGCIFKNPSTIPAGKLIDELGLKGLRFGKARVSDEHGNFIINEGGATASDVLHLIAMIKDRVRKERGIELETEVIIRGDERWPC
jgi:UDP-N-acetylmuramate--alanine ligase